MTMTSHRGTGDNAAVRAELDEWVTALSETVDRLYAEIERIRRGELKPKGGPGAADRGPAGRR